MSAASPLPEPLATVRQHLFLSPHYDDIPLSAGATVNALAGAGRAPRILVIFGSEPDPAQPLSAFAGELHRAWGFSAEEVIASRQAEERAAAATLGASTSVLPFRDAIYRGHQYLSDDDLFDFPTPADATLPDEIVGSLPLGEDQRAETRIYAPLGVGKHVDHQLAFLAGVELVRRGWNVWFYEDIPYALKAGARESRLAELSAYGLEPAAEIAAAPGWERKIDAILDYPSQLETVFRQYVGVGTSRDEISAALLAYAIEAGDGTAVERFWQVSGD